MIPCGLRKLPSPIVDDLRYLRRLSSSCDYSTKTLSQRYPDSRGCTLRGGCDIMLLMTALLIVIIISDYRDVSNEGLNAARQWPRSCFSLNERDSRDGGSGFNRSFKYATDLYICSRMANEILDVIIIASEHGLIRYGMVLWSIMVPDRRRNTISYEGLRKRLLSACRRYLT